MTRKTVGMAWPWWIGLALFVCAPTHSLAEEAAPDGKDAQAKPVEKKAGAVETGPKSGAEQPVGSGSWGPDRRSPGIRFWMELARRPWDRPAKGMPGPPMVRRTR